MSLADRIDQRLAELYAQVPDVRCKGICTDSCGPVDGGDRERARMARAGYRLPSRQQIRGVLADAARKGHTADVPNCPALGADGRCRAYDVRPMICRVWGASDALPCPYGCVPDPGQRRLTDAETMALVDAATRNASIAAFTTDAVEEIVASMTPERRRQWQQFLRNVKPTDKRKKQP